MEQWTLGQRDVRPINQATQRAIMKIVGFKKYLCQGVMGLTRNACSAPIFFDIQQSGKSMTTLNHLNDHSSHLSKRVARKIVNELENNN